MKDNKTIKTNEDESTLKDGIQNPTTNEDQKAEKSEKIETIEKVETPTNKTEEKPIDYKDKYLRTLAEMENLRKRLQKEKSEMISFLKESTISEFLPVLDNFENALKFASSSSEEVQKWSSGFQMLLTQFKDILYNHGIVAFHSEGNHFDPKYHEAMEIVETHNHADGTILEEFAKGYKSDLRVIRPAKVKVAKKPFSEESNK